MAQMKKKVRTLTKEICNLNESFQLQTEHNESPLSGCVCMCAAYLFIHLL